MPERIQRKRTKGWKMPPNTVYVGRPTKWGNPFRVSNGDCPHPDCGPKSHPQTTAQMAVDSFRDWVNGCLRNGTGYPLREIRGKNLACWCPLVEDGNRVPCHADVLLEIANA